MTSPSSPTWRLSISVAGEPAGAVVHGNRVHALGPGPLPDLIAAATEFAPRAEPAELVLVHPVTMGVDEVGDWLGRLQAMGVRAASVRTVPDTEVLADVKYGMNDGRDIVVGDAGTGLAYSRLGMRSADGEPLADAVATMISDAGSLSTWAVLIGSEEAIAEARDRFRGTHVRPFECRSAALAAGALDPGLFHRLADAGNGDDEDDEYCHCDCDDCDCDDGDCHDDAVAGHGAASWKPSRAAVILPLAVGAILALASIGGSVLGLFGEDGKLGGSVITGEFSFEVRRGENPAEAAAEAAAAGRDSEEKPFRPAPPPVPDGVPVPEAVARVFDLFDPAPLFAAHSNCDRNGGPGYENLNYYCLDYGAATNRFAEANGLPELAYPGDVVQVHFSTTGPPDRRLFEPPRCGETFKRVYETPGDTFAFIEEPCDANNRPYEGEWPADGRADVYIVDMRNVYRSQAGAQYPLIRIHGLKDRAAGEALLRHYGLIK
ncbi:hypothetical protein ACFORJ_03025 [Corynebacterium hansenii]|uniref:Uncharacterized protein n=1 Tax=Corynebacterium hansenii TaxID=394964 RepID=A0ABV7ZPH6_9CORY|nr:hypothetical protein [Corynebacterium hansenii]WJY99027.1 hypothetical protein CHAN_01980 [Corynebacterium hansenii]